jgi:hypothetical protein
MMIDVPAPGLFRGPYRLLYIDPHEGQQVVDPCWVATDTKYNHWRGDDVTVFYIVDGEHEPDDAALDDCWRLDADSVLEYAKKGA